MTARRLWAKITGKHQRIHWAWFLCGYCERDNRVGRCTGWPKKQPKRDKALGKGKE